MTITEKLIEDHFELKRSVIEFTEIIENFNRVAASKDIKNILDAIIGSDKYMEMKGLSEKHITK